MRSPYSPCLSLAALLAAVAVNLAWAPLCHGWNALGHMALAEAAVRALPAEVPVFFRKGGPDLSAAALVAHCAVDPDAIKNPAMPQLQSTEEPEHFLDLELWQGHPLPKTRREYVWLCHRWPNADPYKIGFLPYALAEWTQRLTEAFAEQRRWPANRAIQVKCLVYAGILAHYAADAGQPLHCTVHYDGRADAAGRSPRSGIHQKVDGVIEWLGIDADQILPRVQVQAFPDLMTGIMRQIDASNKLVDRVYALEKLFPDRETAKAGKAIPPEIVAFAQERAEASATFVASLFLTAWRDSAPVSLPEWVAAAREHDQLPVPAAAPQP